MSPLKAYVKVNTMRNGTKLLQHAVFYIYILRCLKVLAFEYFQCNTEVQACYFSPFVLLINLLQITLCGLNISFITQFVIWDTTNICPIFA